MNLDTLSGFYNQHLTPIWLLIIILPVSIIIFGCIFYPEQFYDQFIWRYFWGTIEADAQDKTFGEVTESYNPVNTIFYAIIVMIVIYWTLKLFKKFQIEINEKFILSIIPFILIGGISRALEDAELFNAPTVYFFIAPIIYILIGVVVIVLVLISGMIKKYSLKTKVENAVIITGAALVVLDIIYLIFFFFFQNQFSYFLPPIIPILASAFIFFFFKKYCEAKNRIDIWMLVSVIGIWFLVINISILVQWQTIPSWTEAYNNVNPNKTIQLQPEAFFLVLGLSIFAVILVYGIIKILLPKYPKLEPYIFGINLILFFGHFLDASATFIAIDYYGYVEKHVLPTFLIEIFNTASIMFILKAVLVILVIYFIDILYKKDFQNNPTMVGLIKIAVLVLGLAPGTRDVLRLTIGV